MATESLKSALRSMGLLAPIRKFVKSRNSPRLMLWNMGYRLAGNPDHVRIPPAPLLNANSPSGEVAWYLRGGKMAIQNIGLTLRRNGIDPNSFQAILDFGCGVGRVIQRWNGTAKNAALYGTDLRDDLIGWCNKKLAHVGQFGTNGLQPPLRYAENTFDFIYALSVYSHLGEDLQIVWAKEMCRVLKPGGYFYFTSQGEYSPFLDEQTRKELKDRGFAVALGERSGENACASFLSPRFVKEKMCDGFDFVEHVPNGAHNFEQDIYLLRKKRA